VVTRRGPRRVWRRVGWLLLLAALAVLAVRERFDPFLVLFVDDVIRPKPAPAMLRLSPSLELALYEDTRPHIGKIAALQKGLALVHDGEPLIEEGYGFGLPLVRYGNYVYQSRHAEIVSHDARTLVKRYQIDVVDNWTRFLRVKYEDVPPLGTVTMTYTLKGDGSLGVTVDLSDMQDAWAEVYIMNEQGARAFPVYEDSEGTRQHGDDVGRWHPTDDPLGCWVSADEGLKFCVRTDTRIQRYVGRERYLQYNWVRIYALSWSGIDLVLEPPLERYTYTITVEDLGHGG